MRSGASCRRSLTLTQRRGAVSVRASDASAPGTGASVTTAASANAGKEIIPDTEISITKVWPATLALCAVAFRAYSAEMFIS